jgi:hypothetical protein
MLLRDFTDFLKLRVGEDRIKRSVLVTAQFDRLHPQLRLFGGIVFFAKGLRVIGE